MCVNMDVSQFDQAIKLLSAFATPSEPRPEAMFRQDWREHINLVIRAFLEQRRKALKALDREERIALIAEIDAAGLFAAATPPACRERDERLARHRLCAAQRRAQFQHEGRPMTLLPDFKLEVYLGKWEFAAPLAHDAVGRADPDNQGVAGPRRSRRPRGVG